MGGGGELAFKTHNIDTHTLAPMKRERFDSASPSPTTCYSRQLNEEPLCSETLKKRFPRVPGPCLKL